MTTDPFSESSFDGNSNFGVSSILGSELISEPESHPKIEVSIEKWISVSFVCKIRVTLFTTLAPS